MRHTYCKIFNLIISVSKFVELGGSITNISHSRPARCSRLILSCYSQLLTINNINMEAVQISEMTVALTSLTCTVLKMYVVIKI
jgi:hypothetical protein